MFHHRVPFVNHRHRFQTAGILLRSIPCARFYFYTHGDQAVQRAKRQRFREMKRFASSLRRNMCGRGLSAETFSFSFNLTDIFYADTYLHFNEGSVKESYK